MCDVNNNIYIKFTLALRDLYQHRSTKSICVSDVSGEKSSHIMLSEI